MTTRKLLALLSLSLIGCVAEMEDDDVSAVDQALIGSVIPSGPVNFDLGYGEGYLSPAPETREAEVVDGMVGWIETDRVTVYGMSSRVPAFKTKASGDVSKEGRVFMTFSGTIPATGSCTLSSGPLYVRGWTNVEGHQTFGIGPYAAEASAEINVKGHVDGALKYSKLWKPAWDGTNTETRSKSFDKSYYLSSGPSFFATKGQTFELEIQLVLDAWSKESDSSAAISIWQYGFVANVPEGIIQVRCQ